MKIFFVLFFIISISIELSSAPPSPEIQSISTDYKTGHIIIKWINNTTDVSKFIIFKHESNGLAKQWKPYDTIPVSSSIAFLLDSFVIQDPTLTLQPNFYRVEILDNSLTTSVDNNHNIPFLNAHSNIVLNSSIDTCHRKTILRWNRYYGYGFKNSILEIPYYIYKKAESGEETIVPLPSSNKVTDTFRIIENLEVNKNIKYIVKAENRTKVIPLINSSNATSVKIVFKDSLQKILLKEQKSSNNKIYFNYLLTNEVKNTQFILMRKAESDSKFDSINRITVVSGNAINIETDENPNKIYNYKIAMLNVCGKATVFSEETENMTFSAIKENEIVYLKWSIYSKFLGNNSGFDIFRSSSNNTLLLNHINPTLNSYTDNISDISNVPGNGVVCYFIKTKEKDNPDTVNAQITTSSVCITVENIFKTIPQAFTPNNDGKNDTFLPELKFIPKEINMLITDRSGIRVFETKTVGKAWYGTYKNGTKAKAGAYLYYVRIISFDNQKLERTGVVNIIYP